jgi:hypothetical protein
MPHLISSKTLIILSLSAWFLIFIPIQQVEASTVETRYFCNSQSEGYYNLLTSNTASYSTLGISDSGQDQGFIDVKILDENENLVVDWNSVTITGSTYTLYTINVEIPSTEIARVIVIVRVRLSSGATNSRSFRTEEIDASIMGTWNFKMWGRLYYSAFLDVTTCDFRHGSATYNSRVENFEYEEAPSGTTYTKYHSLNIDVDLSQQRIGTFQRYSNLLLDLGLSQYSFYTRLYELFSKLTINLGLSQTIEKAVQYFIYSTIKIIAVITEYFYGIAEASFLIYYIILLVCIIACSFLLLYEKFK